MKEYIKLFNNHNAYTAFTQTEDFVKPNVSLCVQENEVHYNPFSYADEYLTFVAKKSGTFTFTSKNNNVISYSTDGGETWTAGNSVEVNNGDKVMWKGTITPSLSNGVGTFSATGNFDVQGNIMSLLFGGNYKGETDLTGKNYVFYELFKNNTKVISAENLSLPATTLANDCYESMFQGCTSLTSTPELPATTLARDCYYSMFQGCTSLTSTPELPATTLARDCYYSMFRGCTNLTTPPELPANTLAQYCYRYIFYGCKSLTTAPELPATTLAEHCYEGMFYGCTSLTTAPELPATTLANACYEDMFRDCTSLTTAPSVLPATTLESSCYYHMFNGCTSLTTAPELPATSLKVTCYFNMFNGCTSLNYIKAMFTTTPSGTYTDDWVKNVASTGTFVKNSAATWTTTGVNGVPEGWTVQTASE